MDFEELQENLEPVKDALAAHKGKIILLFIIAAAAYAYSYVIAHPGTLTVSVSELDGGPLNDAEVTIIDDATEKALATDLTSGGSVSFYGMPSQKTLKIEVAKGIAYRTGTTTTEIPSGQSQAVEVAMERRNSLSFGGNEIPSSIPVGCADDFSVEVRNAGSDNFEAELIVEGDLAKVLSAPEGRKTVFYNSTTNFSLRAEVTSEALVGSGEGGNLKKGSIRIKKTNRALQLAVRVNRKIQLDASPAEVRISSPKERQKTTIRLFNSGEQPITGVLFKLNGDSDLRAACNNNVESCISIEQLGTGGAEKAILPQNAMLVSLIITPPVQPGKTFLGSLEMSAHCLRKSPVIVPIIIEIAESG